MLRNFRSKISIVLCIALVCCQTTIQAQKVKQSSPKFWFGLSGGANLSFFEGTTQTLNATTKAPTAFHKGKGIAPYGSLFMEYRPGPVFGAMLNLAFDDRSGKFDDVMAPCNCPATLSTAIKYIAIEPSLRIAPFSSGFYIFAGPRISMNMGKSFTYTQKGQTDVTADLSDVISTVISGQVGAGYDIRMSGKNSPTQFNISPFASFHPYFGQEPRKVESWSVTTIRLGVALKMGKKSKTVEKIPDAITEPILIVDPEIHFTIEDPVVVPVSRKVSETFPLGNYIFFDEGSTQIPARYMKLDKNQAKNFREVQLKDQQAENHSGRSAQQLRVYHNILNVLGDRMREHKEYNISLVGASRKGPVDGKALSESVKTYLVDMFGINGSRISTEGRIKPSIPSEKPGGTKQLDLIRQGDRRVDIQSSSSNLLAEVGESKADQMKSIDIKTTQDDPIDNLVIFNVAGSRDLMTSWSLDITDEKNKTQHFGPFTKDQEMISGKSILGNNVEGTYKVVMRGETKNGISIKRESTLHLARADASTLKEGLRFSVLFEFNHSDAVSASKKLLEDKVAPVIPENATVIIHGHTDIIGEDAYNQELSTQRASTVQNILEAALAKIGTKGVKFQMFGFGADTGKAPFENKTPEERFYNRTVIIDIVRE